MAIKYLSRSLIQLVLMSTGGIFIVLLITPPLHSLIAAANPSEIWRTIGSWLRPPFLYLVINGIIISIAASSRLRHRSTPGSPSPEPQPVFEYYDAVLENDAGRVVEAVTLHETTTSGAEVDGNDKFVPDNVDKPLVVALPLQRPDTVEIVTSFFESQIAEPSPPPSSGRRHSTSTRISLQDIVEGEQETYESIWKKITDGRRVPRHLQKSDIRKEDGDHQIASSAPSTPSPIKKSVLSRERRRVGNLSLATNRIVREPSLSLGELNRRVENFIRKSNEEMRLQHQKS